METGDNENDEQAVEQEELKKAPVKELHAGGEEKVAQLEETSENKSKDSTSTFRTYFLSGANAFVLGSVFTLIILSQILASGCDYWVAFWTGQEESRQIVQKNFNETLPTDKESERNDSTTVRMMNDKTNSTSDQLLSTSTCMYIHGTIIATLFLIGISRYKI